MFYDNLKIIIQIGNFVKQLNWLSVFIQVSRYLFALTTWLPPSALLFQLKLLGQAFLLVYIIHCKDHEVVLSLMDSGCSSFNSYITLKESDVLQDIF